MKNKLILFLTVISFLNFSCSSDDSNENNDNNNNTRMANVKMELTSCSACSNTTPLATTFINDVPVEHDNGIPFSYTYSDQEIPVGTVLKLQIRAIVPIVQPQEYTLKIFIDNEVKEMGEITLFSMEDTRSIEYIIE